MMLALKLGRTLEELGATMSAHEFGLWVALWEENHFGELFADQRAGIIASTVANYAGMTRAKGSEPATPADFMLYKPKGYESTAEEDEPDPVQFLKFAKGKD